uniref:Glycoprotein n=1 Tax=Rhabditophanes sp. KR3021 TaxID=114890 RepID=A0AC35TM25_9BILA
MPDRIGLLYERNGTHEGDYLVSDGTHDRSKSLGKIIAWNGRKTVPSSWWSTTQASMINGTDGGLVHPYVTKDERIYIFSTFICRSIYLTFQKEFDYEGVNAYKFGVPKDAWNYEKPEHTGYCHKTTKVYFDHQTPGCLPNGLMDLSRCLKRCLARMGAGKPDIVASMPNFYDAPDSVRNMIEGLDEPNAESDQIYLVVEPRLGTLLKASRRLQVNFGIHSGANISNFAYPRMKAGIIPVITLRENIKIDASNLDEIKERLYKVEETAFWTSCLAIMIGSLLIAIGIMCCCCFHRSRTMGTIKIHDQSI